LKKFISVLFALILAVSLTVPSAALADASIDPSEVSRVTYPGATIEVSKTVTTPTIPSNPDIYFLSDATASMGSVITAVQNNATYITNTILAAQPTAQFGVGYYRDYPGEVPCFINQLSITDDTAAAVAAIGDWTPGGGGDWPEGQFYALDRLAADTDPVGGTIGWRDGPNKIVVWFGDAPAHDPVPMAATGLGYAIDETTVINDLVDAGIKVIAISYNSGHYPDGLDDDPNVDGGDYATAYSITENGNPGQATRITEATDANYFLAATPEEAAAAVLAGIEALTSDVWWEVTSCDSGISVSLDPAVVEDVLGDTAVEFDETISVETDTAPGIYNAVVTFYANSYPDTEGAEIGTQEISIEVKPLVEVEKIWSHTDVCFQQDNDGDGLYDEDPVNFDADGNPLDDDEDGLYNEDDVECDGEYSLGTVLTELEATVNKDKIQNIVPGQFYAVSTVTVVEDLAGLVITENFSDVIVQGIGALNPKNGGGKVVVVKVEGDLYTQIYDAMDEEVVVTDNNATITLGSVAAGDVYKVYVKFEPTLKGLPWPGTYEAINLNCAEAYTGDGLYQQYNCVEAQIMVVEKVGD